MAAAWSGAALARPAPAGSEVRVGQARLHVVRAASGGAGVLVQPTIAGVNDHMRTVAADLAANGFTAVVWDPFRGEPVSGDRMNQIQQAKALRDDRIIADLAAATEYMAGALGLNALGAVGWCMGGRAALVHAGQDTRIGAVSAYNPTILTDKVVEMWGARFTRADAPGQTMDEFALAGAIGGPVQVVRPGEDIAQPDDYARLTERLYARPHPTLVEYYPLASHGFSYTPSSPANIAAGRQSWASTLAMFKAALLPA
jgi:carboxymethylenebutenolidase